MILLFKMSLKTIMILVAIQISCFDYDSEPDAFTPEAKVFVNQIMKENPGATYDVGIVDTAAGGGFNKPIAYVFGLIVKEKAVLTNTIDSLRIYGIYRFNKSGYGTGGGMVDLPFRGIKVKCDTLDSIEIITDSVIALQYLDFSWCNISHMPPQIGKIRTRVLDISWNKGLVLPIEITYMDSLPQPYDSLTVRIDQTWTQSSFDSLPEWTKEWLGTHNLGIHNEGNKMFLSEHITTVISISL